VRDNLDDVGTVDRHAPSLSGMRRGLSTKIVSDGALTVCTLGIWRIL
jgi:hypothetical protein